MSMLKLREREGLSLIFLPGNNATEKHRSCMDMTELEQASNIQSLHAYERQDYAARKKCLGFSEPDLN